MGRITVVGLGPGDPGQVTLAAKQALESGRRLFLRTEIHPTVPALKRWGLRWESFDRFYQQGESFEAVYGRIVEHLLAAAEHEEVVYAVPGHPLVAESTVTTLLAQDRIPVEVVAGLSALDAIYARLGLDPNAGLQVVDALALEGRELRPDWPTIVLQLHAPTVASQVKLHLMRYWPDDHPVVVVRAAGVPGQERLDEVPLYEIDRLAGIDHLSSLYLSAGPARGFSQLVRIVAALRAPDGCPWDREQTPESLRRFILEEAYETVEAIDRGELEAIEEELGDLLLQVVLQAQIFDERGQFDVQDVAETLSTKLVRRHPHVFGQATVADSAEVLQRWEEIKDQEKAAAPKPPESALAGVTMSLPALMVSEKLQGKASRVRFDWKDPHRVLAKIDEEVGELREALAEGHGTEALTHEIGDVLTAVVNFARQVKIDPEEALRQANGRFIRRFQKMEELSRGGFDQLSLPEMEALWQEAKRIVG